MPICGLLVVEADTGTESKGSTGTQEVARQVKGVLQGVLQEVRQVALQAVRRGRQDRRELRGLQEALGSETVEVPQMGRQEGRGRREAWVHVEESLLVPKVVEDQSHCRRLHCCHWGLRQVVRDWVVEEPLQEEVRSWEDFCTMGGAVMDHNYDT